jgi:hypothetical protein
MHASSVTLSVLLRFTASNGSCARRLPATRLRFLAAAIVLLAGCGGDPATPTESGQAVRLTVIIPETVVRGDSLQLAPRTILDDGRERTALSPVYRVIDTSIAAISGTGLVRAKRIGTTSLTVDADGLRASLTLVVVQRLATLQLRIDPRVLSIGDSTPLIVTGIDSSGASAAQLASVRAEPATAAEIRNGWLIAREAARLTIVATAGSLISRDTVVGQGPSNFVLDLVGPPGSAALPTRIVGILDRVRTRLRQVIRVAPLGGRVQLQSNACSNPQPVDEFIVGLKVFVSLQPLPQLVGLGGPCVLREGGGLPLLGEMQLDTAKFGTAPDVVIEQLVLHEMLHVLGLGTLWLQPRFAAFINGTEAAADPVFLGPAALRGWARISGSGAVGNTAVPLELVTRGHWRTPPFADEVFSNRLRLTRQPMSAVTVGALQDLGWDVEPEAYDDFAFTTQSTARVVAKLLPRDSIHSASHELSGAGRTVRLPIAPRSR